MEQKTQLWPEPPTFSDEIIETCKRRNDYREILFEWYKYTGIICNITSCVSNQSPAIKEIKSEHFATLSGLLNRCSRLMLANTRLSCTRRYGETTRLIDRCISESALKVIWLSQNNNSDIFNRYIADGLKKDLELKEIIEHIIADRGGDILPIEKRMIESVDRCVSLSGLNPTQINQIPKLHDLATIFNDLGIDSFMYLAIQKLGSHAVHGTWTDLMLNYLNYDEEIGFSPRDHDIDTQDVQFIIIIHLVLWAIEEFINFVVDDISFFETELYVLQEIKEEITSIQNLTWENDLANEQ